MSYRQVRTEKHSGRQTHGFCGTRFYTLWKAMNRRCSPKNIYDFDKYAGQGITVCDPWLKFENFLIDMYESYLKHVEEFGEKDTSLDRKDPKKGYSPENCRWATQIEQAQNTRSTVHSEDLKVHTYWRKRLSVYMNQCLKKNILNSKFEELFGINLNGFKVYIESQFQPGMTWANHGRHNFVELVWEIDHIIPCYNFDLSKEDNRKRCFNYINLRPVWSKDNRSSKRKKDTLLYA
jgi:hypothetical protein